jgi:hypothetical protein
MRIMEVRGQKVILDADLAVIYGVPTKSLNRAVKRNLNRFPPDFVFQLSAKEAADLRFQIGTSRNAAHVAGAIFLMPSPNMARLWPLTCSEPPRR